MGREPDRRGRPIAPSSLDAERKRPPWQGMEQYALLILFIAMLVIWWWAWAPWKKRPDAPPPEDGDPRNEKPRR
jgi:hypothetical protein